MRRATSRACWRSSSHGTSASAASPRPSTTRASWEVACARQASRPRHGQPTDLQLSIHWDTSSTDIDLWVEEPEGERCYYEHQSTRGGGRLFWDITDGYGPEVYQRPHARGAFESLIDYYGNNSARWAVPTVVLVIRDRGLFGPEDGFTRRYELRLLGEAKALLSVWKEEL